MKTRALQEEWRGFQVRQEELTWDWRTVGLPDAHSPLAAAWASGPEVAGAVFGA